MICLVGLVVASATAEQEVPGSIPGSDIVPLDFSVRSFLVKGTESVFVCLLHGTYKHNRRHIDVL